MKKIILLTPITALILFIIGCAKDQTTTAATVDCSKISAKFTANVSPIIILGAKCGNGVSGCHPSNGSLSDYNAIKKHFDDGHLKSKVIDKIGQMPPSDSPYPQLTDDEFNILKCWIEAGAPNN